MTIILEFFRAVFRATFQRSAAFEELSKAWQTLADEMRANYESLKTRVADCEGDRDRLWDELRKLKGME